MFMIGFGSVIWMNKQSISCRRIWPKGGAERGFYYNVLILLQKQNWEAETFIIVVMNSDRSAT